MRITQDSLRRAQGAVGDAYRRLRDSVCESRVVHTDDTGWRVGGEGAFLMAFETEDATVYQVRARHRNEEVREVVPSEYGGVMVTDRGRSYDAQALSGVRQQKCLAHVLRSISEVVETKRGRGRTPDRSRGHGFGKRLSGLLRGDGTEAVISSGRGVGLCCGDGAVETRGELSSAETARCLIVTTGGFRTSLAGTMTVATCCGFWMIQA